MNWKARWIWMEGEEKPRNLFLMCRKSFKLDGEIVSASLAITADSRYVLYVNGERIGQGPPRSFPWRQNYDLYDITPYLRIGENLIAVLVNHYGHSTFQY
ncbi:TPA: alpha-L-rhamnosidase, partial [Candidatus Poribacteria bacterium]|nr:alpha-L-rhamnosidase [Candidatus Poribacteria bacterium]HEX29092.1 alpha-L-rhamnosidase [Candidatus Poribacteria bacterium]